MLRKCVVILLLLMMLTGCEKKEGPTQNALEFRTQLMQSQGCEFTADITADYGERVYVFTVQVRYTPDETRITVLSPEEISGIEATVKEEGTSISFDGTELDFGKLANGYISPVSAPWLMGQCWIGEYISSAGKDGKMEKVTYLRGYNEQEVTVNTWFNAENIPVQSDVLFGDRRCMMIEIRDFSF